MDLKAFSKQGKIKNADKITNMEFAHMRNTEKNVNVGHKVEMPGIMFLC